MTKRLPSRVYWRRRLLLVVIAVVPIAIVARACTVHTDAPATSPTPQASSSSTPTKSATPSLTPSVTPKPSSSSPKPTPTSVVGDCKTADILVTVTTDATAYVIGSPVTIAMRITNTGKLPCKRDIGALANELLVQDADGLVVWSSDACQTDVKPQVTELKPGTVYGNTQVWSGSNSGRDCTSAAPDATAGTYLALARNDTVMSKPFGFTLE